MGYEEYLHTSKLYPKTFEGYNMSLYIYAVRGFATVPTYDGVKVTDVQVQFSAPEPAAIVLFCLGLAVAGFMRHRRLRAIKKLI
jgi:uncharacterized protein with GYD domain